MSIRVPSALSPTVPPIFGQGLAIASLKINSLLSYSDELRVFMSSSKVDILYINDSKLDSTVRDDEVYTPGFEINGRNGGGVCMLGIEISLLIFSARRPCG